MIRFTILIFCVTLLALPLSTAQAVSIETKAKQAIVMDYETGEILIAKNADAQMPTSSMSKVMTMYVVFEAIKNGQLSLTDTLPVSEKAWRMGGSKMFVEVDKRVKVEDLARGVIIQSGNDATIVLAEGVAGSEDAFAEIMTTTAKNLGMENSNFANASGWPNPDHYSTAEDLAILARALIENHDEYYSYYAEKEFTFNNIKQANRNPLLYKNIGADGIKTGHTEAAGYGLIGSGTYGDRRVIIVINGLEDTRARAEESEKLLEWGLKRFENKTLLKAGDIVEAAPVEMGRTDSLDLVVNDDLRLTVPKGSAQNINAKIRYDGPLVAPIKKGDEIGVLELSLPGEDEPITRPVYANADVAELPLIQKTIAKAKLFLAGS